MAAASPRISSLDFWSMRVNALPISVGIATRPPGCSGEVDDYEGSEGWTCTVLGERKAYGS